MADRLRRVFLALQPERLAHVLASRVAGGDALCERLHGGIDRDIDRKTDVDGRAVHGDRVRMHAIQRAGGTLQRGERLQQGAERRRNAPSRVADGKRIVRFAEDGCGPIRCVIPEIEHLGTRAKLGVDMPRSAHEVRGRCGVAVRRRVADVDATGQAAPRIAPRDLTRRDIDVLIGAPCRERAIDDRSAPRERCEHASVAARKHRGRARDVRALHDESAARILGRLDRRLQRRLQGVEPT